MGDVLGGKLLTHHGTTMVMDAATRTKKTAGRSGPLAADRRPSSVSTMYTYAHGGKSPYGRSCMADDQLTVCSGGGAR